jgi:Na+/proline symporter
MIIGLTVLGLLYFDQLGLSNGNGAIDFEKVLPATINNFLPVGILGLVLTGLLGSFMGTFSAQVNAAQAYIVNDIYLKYINPTASNRTTISMNYLSGIVVVALGVMFGFMIEDVNTALQWIVSGLLGGYVAANVLKWYWWRFNANGFFWGMLCGIIPAIALAVLKYYKVLHGLDLYWWPVLFVLSVAGCLIGTYAAPPTGIKEIL